MAGEELADSASIARFNAVAKERGAEPVKFRLS